MLRHVLPPLLLALLALPAPAGAQEPAPPAPVPPLALPPLGYAGPARSIARGDQLTFSVLTPAPAGSVAIRVSATGETDAGGLLIGDDGTWIDEDAIPAGEGVQAWTAPSSFVLRRRPGRYYWQAYLTDAAAAGAEEPVGPVQELIVTLPAADRGRGRLYPRLGRRGAGTFYLSSAGFPAGVSGARVKALAQTAGARWGLHAASWTSVRPGRRDGYDVAGFSSRLAGGVLGMETDYMRNGRIVEHDLELRDDVDWAQGPDYPALDQIDLESVLLHELGHMAGNRRHKPRCANSPMVEALGNGEWWRGARDHWFFDCSGARTAKAASAGALVHRLVRVD